MEYSVAESSSNLIASFILTCALAETASLAAPAIPSRRDTFHFFCCHSRLGRSVLGDSCLAPCVVFDDVSTKHDSSFVLLLVFCQQRLLQVARGLSKLQSVLKSLWLELRDLHTSTLSRNFDSSQAGICFSLFHCPQQLYAAGFFIGLGSGTGVYTIA